MLRHQMAVSPLERVAFWPLAQVLAPVVASVSDSRFLPFLSLRPCVCVCVHPAFALCVSSVARQQQNAFS
jgi:hypothetical protein